MNKQTIMLKWTNGTTMDKSSRYSKPEPEPEKPIVMEGTFFKKTSERDLNNEKLMSRYMVTQISHRDNPHLCDGSCIPKPT